MRYVIEHLERKLYRWCLLEYRHISAIVGKKSLIFTNIRTEKQRKQLAKLGTVKKESVVALGLQNACILDPSAARTLQPADAQKCKYLIFGGILGDYPMRARTKSELSSRMKNTVKRNLGKEQMPTDNAVYVAKEIVEHGKILEELRFIDQLEIPMKEGEAILLPFRYVAIRGKPLVWKGFEQFVKKKRMF